MSKKIYYCFVDQSLDEARKIIADHRIQYLPVVDKEMRVIGIVTKADLALAERRSKK